MLPDGRETPRVSGEVRHPNGLEWRHSNCAMRCQLGTELARLQQKVQEAEQLIGGMSAMSQALWCDPGDHAFSGRDPERSRYTRTHVDPATGDEKVEVFDTCGEHALKVQPVKTDRKVRKLITSSEYGKRQRTIDTDEEYDEEPF